MTPDEFRRHGYELVDWVADYLDGVEHRRVNADVAPGDIRAMLPAHAPTEPESFNRVMADVNDVVLRGLAHWQHPAFFAYFPANSSHSSILAALLGALKLWFAIRLDGLVRILARRPAKILTTATLRGRT
ncbi:hypothetical protein BH20ACT4_BH20ACT4_14140 [soil metagenome]